MNIRKVILVLLFTIFSIIGLQTYAQTVLSPGDIFIVTVNATNPDLIEFVPRINLQTGTTIYFSDNGRTSTGSWRTGEGYITFTATSFISRGTIIGLSGLNTSPQSIYPAGIGLISKNNTFDLSTIGETILVYQGSVYNTGTPSFLYGFGFGSGTTWVSSGTLTPNTSYLPSTLTIGQNAIGLYSGSDVQYNCSNRAILTTGFISAIHNPANWNYNISTRFSPSTCVFDFAAPIVTINGSGTITIPWGGSYIEQGAVWSDDHSPISGSINGDGGFISGSIDTYGLPGTYYIQYIYVDTAGQTGFATRTVIISNPPIPNPQDDFFTGNQDTDIDLSAGQHTANDSGMQYVTSGYAVIEPAHGSYVLSGFGFVYTPDLGFAGVDTITYALCNIINECDTAIITFTILDTQAPIITLSGSTPETIEAGSTRTDQGATWIDNVDGSGIIITPTSGSVDINTPGVYTLEYTYTDTAGNTGNIVTRVVEVVDNPPTVTLNGSGSITIPWGSAYIEQGAVWSDDIDGTGDVSWISGSVDTYGLPGTYYIQYIYIDTIGQTGSIIREVIIENPGIPDPQNDEYIINQDTFLDLTTPPNVVVVNDSGMQFTTSGGLHTAPLYGTVLLTGQGFVYTPNSGYAGVDTLRYELCNILNECDNALVTFTILDTQAPIITLSGSTPETIEAGSTRTDQGATCTDNVSCVVTQTGSVDTNTPATYTITYTATDLSGNTSSITRTVIVQDTTSPADTTPPVITLSGNNNITITQGNTFVDPGATCIDNVDGNLSVSVSGSVDTNITGTYILTYTCIDNSSNITTGIRTIVVQPTPVVPTTNTSFAGGGGGSSTTTTDNEDDTTSEVIIGEIDKNILNPTISPDTCFSPMDILTIDQGGMTSYQKIAHQLLYSYGLTTIPGTLDFGPSRNMTRAEAAKFFVNFAQNVLCRSKIHTYDNRFVDINESHPDLQTNIKLSYEYGIFYGYEGGLFKPDDLISRDELIATMVRLVTAEYDDLEGTGWADNYKNTLSSRTSVSLSNTIRANITEVIYNLYKDNNYTLEDIGYVLD